MGALITETTAKYLRSKEFRPFMIYAKDYREERLRRWLYWNPNFRLEWGNMSPYSVDLWTYGMGDPEEKRGTSNYVVYYNRLMTSYPHLVRKGVLPPDPLPEQD